MYPYPKYSLYVTLFGSSNEVAPGLHIKDNLTFSHPAWKEPMPAVTTIKDGETTDELVRKVIFDAIQIAAAMAAQRDGIDQVEEAKRLLAKFAPPESR